LKVAYFLGHPVHANGTFASIGLYYSNFELFPRFCACGDRHQFPH